MKRLGWIVVLMLGAVSTFGQGFSGQPADKKFYFGGGGSFGSGTNSYSFRYTYYSLFPIVGYRITPQFSAGTGVNYQHYSYPDLGATYSQYGFSPFLRYNVSQLFFQSEYDIISSPAYDNAGNALARQTYNRLLFGVGYTQPFSDTGRGAINAMAMYDVLYKQPSVFNSPIVLRVFVTF
jgi:hypothetical protein